MRHQLLGGKRDGNVIYIYIVLRDELSPNKKKMSFDIFQIFVNISSAVKMTSIHHLLPEP